MGCEKQRELNENIFNEEIDLDTNVKGLSKKLPRTLRGEVTFDLKDIYMELSFDEELNIEVIALNLFIKIREEQYSQYVKSTLQDIKTVCEKRKLTL